MKLAVPTADQLNHLCLIERDQLNFRYPLKKEAVPELNR